MTETFWKVILIMLPGSYMWRDLLYKSALTRKQHNESYAGYAMKKGNSWQLYLNLIDFICVHVCFILNFHGSNAGFSKCTVHICAEGWPESKGLNVQSTSCIVALENGYAPPVYFHVFICMYKRIVWIKRHRYSSICIVIFENDCAVKTVL